MSHKNYTNITITPLPDREVEIIGQITAEKMALMREKALAKFKESIEIDGFRKGNAPDTLVAQKVGEGRLLEEAAEIALLEEYPNILEEHNVDAIGRPDVTITKLGIGSVMEFKATTAVMPEVKLGDYKKIAKTELAKEDKTPEVTDKEIEDVIKNLQQRVAHQTMHDENGLDEHNHNHGEIKDEDLPEVTDEFAKIVGKFKDVADMREKIKENIGKEKEIKEKDKKRTKILEGVIEKSTIELPKIIVEGEMEKMIAQFKDDIARAGVSYEDYLTHIKKTEEDLKKEWHDTAVKRAKSQVILNTIAKNENLTPDDAEVKKEMEHIIEHYGDADRFRVRMYVETFLTNELVFKFLEEQK
jgi:FKBP-type peptidyl-prolyl cis-trans isomerase (trigger factor)